MVPQRQDVHQRTVSDDLPSLKSRNIRRIASPPREHPCMNPQAFIAVSNLHKHYVDGEGQELHILRGLDLTVPRGKTAAIMGASGAGKSTLLHLVGALDRPDRGDIEVGGRRISELNAEEAASFRNQTVGFVFQFHHLLMDFTALENVMMPLWIHAGRTGGAEEKARELLERVGLSNRGSHRPAQLSGGEQQRVAIARAIATGPQVLLADEPTGNLDEESAGQVTDLLLDLNRRQGLTLLLVTHNPQLAARMDNTFVLEQGRLRPAAVPRADA
jgi:lipoprotein-releasing system ATP-binding protein